MKLLRSAALLFLPALLAAAPPQAPPTKTLTLAAAKKLLVGTWQATDDPNVRLLISQSRYVEKYKAETTTDRSLMVHNQPCGEVPAAMPASSIYLNTGETCYYLVSVSATRLETSPVGGRGNTLSYRRVAAPVRK